MGHLLFRGECGVMWRTQTEQAMGGEDQGLLRGWLAGLGSIVMCPGAMVMAKANARALARAILRENARARAMLRVRARAKLRTRATEKAKARAKARVRAKARATAKARTKANIERR